MYTQDFYITAPVGNNAFSYNTRKNKKLFVPRLKKIQGFDEVRLMQPLFFFTEKNRDRYQDSSKKVTFEDHDFDNVLQTCYGLENLYEAEWWWKKVYLVDNHNHVFYFWYLSRSQGIISDNTLLYHVDEHADTRDPWEYLMKSNSQDLQKVFEYTNFTLNVGNYIIPAQKEWLIWEVAQIRSEEALEKYNSWAYENVEQRRSIILNLDLDFFEPELDYIDYDLKKQVILDIAKKADLITICTSPFFIDQERALDVLKDLFD